MDNEEKDIYIKDKIKDGYIPEKIDNLFNNSIKIIENKGEKQMEENLNMNQNQEQQNNQNKPEKKKMPVALKRIIATAACLTVLLGGGNIYASSQGYDNIFFLIMEKLGISTDVFGKDNILSDRDITISYRPIEIAKGTQIQINNLVIKDNEAKLKVQINETNQEQSITPLKYVVKDENGSELYSNVDSNLTILYGDVNCDGQVTKEDSELLLNHLSSNEELTEQGKINADVNADGKLNNRDATVILHYLEKWEGYETLPYNPETTTENSQYKEELILNNFKEDTKKLTLEIYNVNSQKIVDLEIDLQNKRINVIGNAEEVTKISEEELKQYLGAFAMLTYKGTEYRDFSKDSIEVENTRKMITALRIAEIKGIDLYTGEKFENDTGYTPVLDREKVNKLVESFTTIELNDVGAMQLSDEYMFFASHINGKEQYFDDSWVVGFEPICLDVTDIAYINGIYNVAFKFCYATLMDVNKIEELPIYEASIGLILDENNEYSKYRVSTISEAILEEKQGEEVIGEKDTTLNFDLSFLKIENQKRNKIYSPLSIRYALKMLEEGMNGDSKLQISNLIGSYPITKYNSNRNMSLANALFIKDSFKDGVKESYINNLRTKYNAEIIFDSFSTAKNVNSWVSDKTLNLIDNILGDIDPEQKFLLINALGIDMEWEQKFLQQLKEGHVSYEHENFGWSGVEQVSSHEFDKNEQLVSGMKITASINNYDIVTELGEENIRKTVGEEFRKWAKSLKENDWEYDDWFSGDLSDENIEKELAEYLDGTNGYISEINSNYGRVDKTTDFSLYVDDNVKAFAKDLKEYDGTTLQYIGIMPTSEDLDSYVKNIDETKINNIINNLKDLKLENFKSGVVTKITGYIPKFKFEYELNLKEDLKQLGITDVFEEGKANLTEICDDEQMYINDAVHKANIEFTQDGIKAAAATILGGLGAGGSFDYIYDIPVEEIDLTFDKPYMFLIRDKETGEIWFVGTVYEPLSWEDEPEKDNAY